MAAGRVTAGRGFACGGPLLFDPAFPPSRVPARLRPSAPPRAGVPQGGTTARSYAARLPAATRQSRTQPGNWACPAYGCGVAPPSGRRNPASRQYAPERQPPCPSHLPKSTANDFGNVPHIMGGRNARRKGKEVAAHMCHGSHDIRAPLFHGTPGGKISEWSIPFEWKGRADRKISGSRDDRCTLRQ